MSVFLLFFPAHPPSPIKTQKFFPMGIFLPFNSSLDDIKISSGGRKEGKTLLQLELDFKTYIYSCEN